MDGEDRQEIHDLATQSAPVSPSPKPAGPFWLRHRLWQLTGASLLAALALVAGFFLLRTPPQNGVAQQPSPLFINWGKPDLAIIISGEMHGYHQPCGCSSPQFGGLARRYEFIKSLRKKDWQVAAIDLGDVAPSSGPQAMVKYVYAMRALNLMGYSAIGIGQREFNMPLHEALANYSINNEYPRPLARNLQGAQQPGEEYYDLNVRGTQVLDKLQPRVGIVGIVAPSVASKVLDKNNIKFLNNAQVLPIALQELQAKKAEIGIVLYQGSEQEARTLAQFCDKLHRANPVLPRIHAILCVADAEEPPALATIAEGTVARTQIITIGHKGRYVGVIGVFPRKKEVELKYQLVSMSPEFETPKNQDHTNPLHALMEEFARTLKSQNYLAKFPRSEHPMNHALKKIDPDLASKYVGSEMCANCHEHAAKVWENSKHSHAYEALVNATRPALRQFDGECVVCHTVGFAHHTGFLDPTNNPRQNTKLLHVGCESCHGPAGAHVNNPQNKNLYPLINPWKQIADPQKRLARIDQDLCQKCHDLENDVHWSKVPFHAKWIEDKIIHATPKNGK